MAISPDRLPISRPDLPRASSAMSGFFFCGMMLDPVDHESCSVAKSNSRVVQRMTSSARRERSTPTWAVTKANSAAKSRDAVPSMELADEPVKPSSARDRLRVEAERLAGEGAGAVRRVARHARVPVVAAARRRAAAATRGPAGGATGAPAGRAGGACARASPSLIRGEVLPGLPGEHVDQVEHQAGDRARVVAQVGPEQRGDLVVARAPRPEPAADLGADLVEQQPLEGAVDVLVGGRGDQRRRRRTAPPAPTARAAARRGRPR